MIRPDKRAKCLQLKTRTVDYDGTVACTKVVLTEGISWDLPVKESQWFPQGRARTHVEGSTFERSWFRLLITDDGQRRGQDLNRDFRRCECHRFHELGRKRSPC